jgi:hypothetical protein
MDAFWAAALILALLFLANETRSRIKYSRHDIFRQKQERLRELDEAVMRIESGNHEAMELIESMDLDADIDEGLADRLIKYRADEIALRALKKEQGELRKYLKAARRYVQL